MKCSFQLSRKGKKKVILNFNFNFKLKLKLDNRLQLAAKKDQFQLLITLIKYFKFNKILIPYTLYVNIII